MFRLPGSSKHVLIWIHHLRLSLGLTAMRLCMIDWRWWSHCKHLVGIPIPLLVHGVAEEGPDTARVVEFNDRARQRSWPVAVSMGIH